MFNGHGRLSLDGDHLDISYRRPETWPAFSPKGSIKAHVFDIGDSDAGPSIQLGLMSAVEDEKLDWKHSIDPVHHHGSDQFRVLSGGDWVLAGRPLAAGEYAFQEAGWIYQEHPGPNHTAWMCLVMGDRRGNQATLKLGNDHATLVDAGDLADVYGAPKDGAPYPHPAGDKGLAAVATTVGPCERGYLRGRIAEVPGGALTGVLGDETVGPVVHVLKCDPGEVAVPACSYPTERMLVVAKGSCTVGADAYSGGDIRLQAAGAPMAAVVAGPDGLQAVLVVADRRARPALKAADETPPAWMEGADEVLRKLVPVPGGVRHARSASRPLERRRI